VNPETKITDKDILMKKKMLITLITAVIVIMAIVTTIIFLVFVPEQIIKFKTVTIFKFEKNVHQDTIVGVLVADCAKPKYFNKSATLAIGFQKPLFCYFGSAPTHEGTPIPVDMSKSNMDKIYFFYLIQGKNNFTYDKSITFVCKQKTEGYYIGYVIPFCIHEGKVYGEMFSSAELYEILMDLSNKNGVSLIQDSAKTK
jgi:hypothetical protein